MPDEAGPLVLVSNQKTASGHAYADRTGVSYEYPTRYRSMIVPGSPFVYYRSREGSEQPNYFGTGVVGRVSPSGDDPTRLQCEIVDYRPFERAIPFRDAAGEYLEAKGNRRGYYQPGVRRITDDELAGILNLAQEAPPEAGVIAGQVPPVEATYSTSEFSRLVDAYAVKQVMALLREAHPSGEYTIREMPHNNPGFDVLVLFQGRTYRYVEVKGTTLATPVFFISEGERKFSKEESRQYTLYVVYNIRLDAESHDVVARDGEVTVEDYGLVTVQWRGRIE